MCVFVWLSTCLYICLSVFICLFVRSLYQPASVFLAAGMSVSISISQINQVRLILVQNVPQMPQFCKHHQNIRTVLALPHEAFAHMKTFL